MYSPVMDWRAEIAEVLSRRDRRIIFAYTTENQPTTTEVGELFGVSHTTISNVLDAYGIKARPRGMRPNHGPLSCWHCGEVFNHEPLVVIFNETSGTRAIVHTDPCGTWLLERGWEVNE